MYCKLYIYIYIYIYIQTEVKLAIKLIVRFNIWFPQCLYSAKGCSFFITDAAPDTSLLTADAPSYA